MDRTASVAAPAPVASHARVAAASSGHVAFICVDFVCVNRSSAVRNLFDYPLSVQSSFRSYDSFSSCVQHCVASSVWKPTARPTQRPTPPHPPPPRKRRQPPPSSSSSSSSLPPRPGAHRSRVHGLAPLPSSGLGLVHVGNRSLDAALTKWLDQRHRQPCSLSDPVYFAPFSPNGIGNKLLAIVMAFHMSLMTNRRLVVSDWPPRTLDTAYPLEELLLPSRCTCMHAYIHTCMQAK